GRGAVGGDGREGRVEGEGSADGGRDGLGLVRVGGASVEAVVAGGSRPAASEVGVAVGGDPGLGVGRGGGKGEAAARAGAVVEGEVGRAAGRGGGVGEGGRGRRSGRDRGG